jgi:uncharacterized DUF497 family protein
MTYAVPQNVEWDEAKNLANQKKHDVSFEEASELLGSGEEFLEVFDVAHSGDEDRFIAIGPIARGVVLVVWTQRDDDVVRIISARWATKRERASFIEHMERLR